MITNSNPLSRNFPELFHYTNVVAFEKIYKEQKFRATHYEDLNDASELQRFRLKVYSDIRPTIKDFYDNKMRCDVQLVAEVNRHGGIEKVVNQDAATLFDAFYNSTFGKGELQPFVCSFCSHDAQSYEAKHGLLSQWRGYGADGGVSIVLDALCIEKLLGNETKIFGHPINHIGDVIYDDDDKRIREEFEIFFDSLKRSIKEGESMLSSLDSHTASEIFFNFLLGSTMVKHHAFHEENEIRIVVSPKTSKGSRFYNSEHDSKSSKIVRYAQRGNREARYIDLFGEAPLPIKRIIVGPSKIQNLNYQKIKDQIKHDDIKVFKSEIPFLG